MSAILKRLVEEGEVVCINGVANNADAKGVVLWCDECDNIQFYVHATNGGTPVAAIEIWFSNDRVKVEADSLAGAVGPGVGSAEWKKCNIDPTAVHGGTYTAFTAAQDHIDWTGGATLDIGINLNDPFMYMCPVYNQDSAGQAGAGAVSVRAIGRRKR